MKKILLTLTMMFSTMTLVGTWAQNNDSLVVVDDSTVVDEVEAFSDTTETDTGGVTSVTYNNNFPFDDEDFVSVDSVFKDLDIGGLAGMGFVLLVLLILFVLAPVFIIGLILFFVYKNRKQRMKLAEMAIKNGQPIPSELVDSQKTMEGDLRAKGIRQTFLGIGLTCFLGWVVGDIGAGIGILVLCIGLGNLLIARNAQKKRDEQKENEIIENDVV